MSTSFRLRAPRASLLLLALAPLTAASFCEPPPSEGEGEGEGEGEVECFVGDENAEPAGEIGYRTVDGTFALLEDGGEVPMIFAPQGRFAMMLGARMTNMDMCSLVVTAGIFDDCAEPPRVLSRELRPINVDIGADGFATPLVPDTLNNYANLDLTFNFASTRDIDGEPYRYEVRYTDRKDRTLVLTGTLVPTCGQPELAERCRCDADADFSNTANCADIADVDPDVPPGTCPDVTGEGEGEGE